MGCALERVNLECATMVNATSRAANQESALISPHVQ